MMTAVTMAMTATSTERRALRLLAALSLSLLAACGAAVDEPADERGHEHGEGDGFAVTAWGERYEVFPEIEPLAVGHDSAAHVHVTVLHPDGTSSPLAEGRLAVVLRGPAGEESFAADGAARPGVFEIDLAPERAGERELLFRVASPAGDEEIRGGRVLVGDGEAGRLLAAPAPRGAGDGGEPLEFSKEDQWRSDFATDWVRRGALQRGVEGLARVRPPAGGEAVVTAPFEAVVAASPWPHPGQRVRRGETLFRLLPRVEAARSLAALEAERAALEAELATARGRLARLEELLAIEAVSRREVEEARTREASLAARFEAAGRDLEAARSARSGLAAEAAATALAAPLTGEVSAVAASPGAAVGGGETLARLVRTDAVWLAVAVPAESSPAAFVAGGLAGAVIEPPGGEPLRLADDELRLVAVAPEVDPRTGTVDVLVETAARPELVLGTVVDATLLAAREREGIVVPATALIDDGGVPVVYLQLSGERFARQAVRVVERQGERVLVDGLTPGQRLVTRGGAAVRRSSLMGSGDSHGHVH